MSPKQVVAVAAGVLAAAGFAHGAHAQRARQPATVLSASMDVVKVHGQVYLVAGPASNAVVQVGDQFAAWPTDTFFQAEKDMYPEFQNELNAAKAR